MDWLRDPIWQFIGILVGLATFVLAAFWQKKRKKIAYEIISNTQLLSVKDEVKSRLQILFDQKPVHNLNLVVLKIYNAGNEPISPEDFKDKLTVEFGDNAQILEADVVDVFPKNMQANIEQTANSISLVPLLLNDGDSVKLKILLSKYSHIHITGRITGVNQISGAGIEQLTPRSFLKDLATILGFAVVGTVCGAIAVSLFVSEKILPAIILALLGLFVLFITAIGTKETYEKIKNLLT